MFQQLIVYTLDILNHNQFKGKESAEYLETIKCNGKEDSMESE